MEFLPKALGTRPRLAIEIRPEGVVAARAENAAALLTAVSRSQLAAGTMAPGLRPGNVADRTAVVAAVRAALDSVAGRGGPGAAIGRDVTIVVPDAAARVLLVDFDSLPGKAVEAMPVVRFRLKKLLPFDVEEAAVSYQAMSSSKSGVQALAVAMPREVLAEYEDVVTAAGYQPGAVLPSTLAALAGLDESASAVLVVNAGAGQLTSAIVRAGVLLLHRTIDLSSETVAPALVAAAAYGEDDLRSAEVATTAAASSEVPGYEIAQAVSVAAAYFEDTLAAAPETLLSVGSVGAEALERMLTESGLEGLRVKEMVEPAMLDTAAVSSSVPRGWLAGVRGALKG